jgi:hypothetical protein
MSSNAAAIEHARFKGWLDGDSKKLVTKQRRSEKKCATKLVTATHHEILRRITPPSASLACVGLCDTIPKSPLFEQAKPAAEALEEEFRQQFMPGSPLPEVLTLASALVKNEHEHMPFVPVPRMPTPTTTTVSVENTPNLAAPSRLIQPPTPITSVVSPPPSPEVVSQTSAVLQEPRLEQAAAYTTANPKAVSAPPATWFMSRFWPF